jgi:hypothetical protein
MTSKYKLYTNSWNKSYTNFIYENSFNNFPKKLNLISSFQGLSHLAKCEFQYQIQSLSSNLNMLDSKTQFNFGTSVKD